MKTLDEYLSLPYRMEVVPDTEEGGFVVSYPDLPGCLSCGNTLEQAISNAADAKRAWLEAALADGVDIADPDTLEVYSGQLTMSGNSITHTEALNAFAQLRVQAADVPEMSLNEINAEISAARAERTAK